jgi:hypothetical protein
MVVTVISYISSGAGWYPATTVVVDSFVAGGLSWVYHGGCERERRMGSRVFRGQGSWMSVGGLLV